MSIMKSKPEAHTCLGGGSESMNRQGCAILALKVVPTNLIFE